MSKIVPVIFIIGLAGLLFFTRTTPQKTAEEEIGCGEFNDGVFSHDYFGMSVEFPADWVMQNRETQKKSYKKAGRYFFLKTCKDKRKGRASR